MPTMNGKLFFTADTHDLKEIYRRFHPDVFPEGYRLTKNDYVVILGDSGIAWEYSGITAAEARMVRWLEARPWSTLIVDGNNDCIDRLKRLPLVKAGGGEAGRFTDSVLYLRRGEVYNFAGRSMFIMGGAMSINRHLRAYNETWWSDEIPSRYDVVRALSSLEQHANRVDLILTHAAPSHISPLLPISHFDINDPTQSILDGILSKNMFQRWLFGHYHVNWEGHGANSAFACIYDDIALLTPENGLDWLHLGDRPRYVEQPVRDMAKPAILSSESWGAE